MLLDKTEADREKRLSELQGIREKAQLSNAQAGEYDAIRRSLSAWNEYRRKHYVC